MFPVLHVQKKTKASRPRPTSSLLCSRSWNELGTSAVCPRGLLGMCGMCSFRTSCAQVVSQNVAHTFFGLQPTIIFVCSRPLAAARKSMYSKPNPKPRMPKRQLWLQHSTISVLSWKQISPLGTLCK